LTNLIGVLGGMGPDATISYLSMVVENTDAHTDQDHVDLDCVMHCSIPDRTAYILDRSQPSPVPDLLHDIATLGERGAAAIAIPCNTAHFFFDELQASTTVPIMNMLDLAVASLQEQFPQAKRVAVLGTRGTAQSGVYRPALEAAGLDLVDVREAGQQLVDTVIFDRVKAGFLTERELYCNMLQAGIDAGSDALILACTELSVPERQISHDFPTSDALVALARATVIAAGKSLKALQ
jgi:aspartate racemase